MIRRTVVAGILAGGTIVAAGQFAADAILGGPSYPLPPHQSAIVERIRIAPIQVKADELVTFTRTWTQRGDEIQEVLGTMNVVYPNPDPQCLVTAYVNVGEQSVASVEIRDNGTSQREVKSTFSPVNGGYLFEPGRTRTVEGLFQILSTCDIETTMRFSVIGTR